MKMHILLNALLFFGSSFVSRAQDVMVIEMNDSTIRIIRVEDIRQMTFQIGFDPSCPEADAIDLGLPSGTKWASWNIGASAPEGFGNYYAWGETETKDSFLVSNYDSYDLNTGFVYIGRDIAGTNHDVAYVKWGGSWRMPSHDQQKELSDKCSWTWVAQNGVNGMLVTGPNGNSIFLPAAGHQDGDDPSLVGELGSFWSSSIYPLYNYSAAFNFYFYSNFSTYGLFCNRYVGLSVRAVCP